MAFDDIFAYLGDFGRYQKRIYLLVTCLPAITSAFHMLASVFLLAKPHYRCELPYENPYKNISNINYTLTDDELKMSYPIDSLTNKWSTCQYFDTNYSAQYFLNGIPANNSVYCDKYIYDKSKHASSIVMEWDLVCSKSWLRASSDALFMVGVLLGSIIFGQMSDRIGRKPIFFASLVLQLIFGITAGIAPEYVTYTISRVFVGAATTGVFLVSYVIAMEMVGPAQRLYAGIICMMFFSCGYILIAGFAYFINNWRNLQIAITLPGILFMCYYWFIPESPRWLLAKNRKDEAIEILKVAAKENGVAIPDEIFERLIDVPSAQQNAEKIITKEEGTVIDLFRYPNLRTKSLLIFFNWFVNSATYYGLSWNTNNLGDNNLVNFIISGVVEFPAYTLLLFTLNRWGRRNILSGCMLISGTMLLLTIVIPEEHNWAIIVLAMIGKLAITSSYGTIYIFTAEQFPTPVRNVGLGASSMVARFGSILAPYINLLAEIWKPFPLLIFGLFAFTAGLSSLHLPETLNKKLPETIIEGENFGKKLKKIKSFNIEL